MSDRTRKGLSRLALLALLGLGILLNLGVGSSRAPLPALSSVNQDFVCTVTTYANETFLKDANVSVGTLTKIGPAGPVFPGADIDYEVLGSFNETNLEDLILPYKNFVPGESSLTDELPTDALFKSLSQSGFDACTTPAVGASGTIGCTDENDTLQLLVGAKVAALAGPQTLHNDVEWILEGNFSTLPINSTRYFQEISCSAAVSLPTDVISPSNLTAEKTVTGDFTVGGDIVYEVVITNNGPYAQADVSGDEFVDILPSELQLDCGGTFIDSGGGSLTCTEGTNTVAWSGSLAVSSTVTLEIAANIVSAPPSGIIENQGLISYDADGDGVTNDGNGSTDDPGTVPVEDPTAFALALDSIPTTGALGLLALAVLIALAALPVIRR